MLLCTVLCSFNMTMPAWLIGLATMHCGSMPWTVLEFFSKSYIGELRCANPFTVQEAEVAKEKISSSAPRASEFLQKYDDMKAAG